MSRCNLYLLFLVSNPKQFRFDEEIPGLNSRSGSFPAMCSSCQRKIFANGSGITLDSRLAVKPRFAVEDRLVVEAHRLVVIEYRLAAIGRRIALIFIDFFRLLGSHNV